MAEATLVLTGKKVERLVRVPDEVRLSLTPHEAVSLLAVLRNVGGGLTTSARRWLDKIESALLDAGVPKTVADGLHGELVAGQLSTPAMTALVDRWNQNTAEATA